MASTYSLRFRLNYQAPGDNLNTWGTSLNTGVFQLLEDALAKRVPFTLSGPKTLSTVNGAADEARCAFLDMTGGTGGTVTIPAVEKWYIVRNGGTGAMVVSTGSGLTSTFYPGEVSFCVCDATNVRKLLPFEFGGSKITDLADPTNPNDAATKGYVDTAAFNANAGILPGQGGSAGGFLKTNGTSPAWTPVTTADLADYDAQTNKRALRFALIF